MDFEQLIIHRQSTRSYDNKRSISREDLDRILQAGALSPSARNRQPWKFYVADKCSDKFMQVVSACQSGGANACLSDCSAVVVVVKQELSVVDRMAEMLADDFRPYDIGLAIAHMVLQAKSIGIDSLIVGWINVVKMRKALNLGKKAEIGLVVALGYAPADYQLRDKNRRPLDQTVEYI
ncbi:MAG: nitroreductase family protein [Clostridia bacterium]|nr:nitroreductase family protein [Clostridia bacterium]